MSQSRTDDSTAGRHVSPAAMLAWVVLVSVNLRPAIVSVSPLLEQIRADLQLSYTLVSLLTAIPIFCMGFFALATPAVTRRFGREGGVFWGVALVCVATAARLAGDNALVLFGTVVLVGIGIAVIQALLPAIVGTYFPDRPAFATGLYTVGLTVGATLASGLSVTIQRAFGSWTVALAAWALLAVGALVVGIVVRRQVGHAGSAPTAPPVSTDRIRVLLGSRFAWLITLFFALNVSVYYSLLTWLAPRYVALGWSEQRAALLLTVFVLTGLAGMLAVTAFGDRSRDRRLWIVPLLASLIAGTTGAAFVPTLAPWIWATALGMGSGGIFTLMLVLPVDFADDRDGVDAMSSMALGGGYMLGALVPSLVGRLRDLVGSFRPAFVVLVVLAALSLLTGLLLSPDGTVGRE